MSNRPVILDSPNSRLILKYKSCNKSLKTLINAFSRNHKLTFKDSLRTYLYRFFVSLKLISKHNNCMTKYPLDQYPTLSDFCTYLKVIRKKLCSKDNVSPASIFTNLNIIYFIENLMHTRADNQHLAKRNPSKINSNGSIQTDIKKLKKCLDTKHFNQMQPLLCKIKDAIVYCPNRARIIEILDSLYKNTRDIEHFLSQTGLISPIRRTEMYNEINAVQKAVNKNITSTKDNNRRVVAMMTDPNKQIQRYINAIKYYAQNNDFMHIKRCVEALDNKRTAMNYLANKTTQPSRRFPKSLGQAVSLLLNDIQDVQIADVSAYKKRIITYDIPTVEATFKKHLNATASIHHVRGFRKLNRHAFIPQRINNHAAGYDLQALHTVVMRPFKLMVIKTGVTSYMPKRDVGILANRSSNPVKRGLIVPNGVGIIDSDYTGDIGVELMNINKHDYIINRGQKIAQFIFMTYQTDDMDEPVTDSQRGKHGFGYHFWKHGNK